MLLVLFTTVPALATDGTRSGASSAVWATSGNWTGGVPGTGNTATFNGTGNANTIIDLGAGVTVKTNVFDTASVAAYTIGSGAVGSQTLTLNDSGGITMNSTVANDQLYNANINLGTAIAGTYTVVNASTKTLTLAGAISGGTGGTAGAKTLNIGAGNVTISGGVGNGGATSVALNKNNTGTLTLSGTLSYTGDTGVSGNGSLSVGTLPPNGTIVLGGSSSAGSLIYTGPTLSTAHSIKFNSGGGALFANGYGPITYTADFIIAGNVAKALNFRGVSTDANTMSGKIGEVSSTYWTRIIKSDAGTWVLSGLSTFSSYTTVNAGVLSINSISSVASPAPSALGQPVTVANGTIKMTGGTLQYTGPATSTDRVIDLSGTGGVASLDASGSGPISFVSDFTSSGLGSKTLTLKGANTVNNNIAGKIVDNSAANTTSLVKSDLGTWVLSGTNTYSGPTFINAGVLALSGGALITNTPNIVVASNAIFDVSGLSNAFTLASALSSQTLSNSAPGAILNGTNDCSAGTLSLVYDGVTPSFLITNGTMTLSSSTTIKVNNPGATLLPGSYKIIAKATAGNVGLVTGTVPGSVTVVGGPSGVTPALAIVNGELYLNLTNHPPVANLMTVTRTAGLALIISLSDVATNWTDSDSDQVSLTGVTMQSTNGVNLFPLNWSTNLDGSLVTTSAFIGYTNSPNVADQISYSISDGHGGTNIGYVNIVIQSSVTGTNSITGIDFASPYSNTITAYGIPTFSYILERATNLSSPVWVDVQTNQAATNGIINAADTFWDLGGIKPNPSAFYQLKWQP